jgi:DNA-binding transcriptional ArsR family regulator
LLTEGFRPGTAGQTGGNPDPAGIIQVQGKEVPLSRNRSDAVEIHEEAGPGGDYLQRVAFLAKSLSDENRLRILLSLGNGKKAVSQIVEELNLSQPLVSHHLKELRRSLLVNVERRGPFVYYEMSDHRIIDILSSLETLALELLARRTSF